ncbi:MAG: geranylgeranylglyceryl/heptaprenylglyceryl phosphate synthase [Gelidibacter sp.]
MRNFYEEILHSKAKGAQLLAVLIDPEKMKLENVSSFISKVNETIATHIFVGGSTVDEHDTDLLVSEIKKYSSLPIFLFPGDVTQITDKADVLLFLSLISGRNPEYLIGKHVEAVSTLKHTNLEVIPTGYILIENGKETSVQRVTNTKPMSRTDVQQIIDTAKAGELLGMRLIYLEAGSGALHSVPSEIVSKVKANISIPLIVGGGIKTKKQLENAYHSGADMVVIGTAFEENEDFFLKLQKTDKSTPTKTCYLKSNV